MDTPTGAIIMAIIGSGLLSGSLAAVIAGAFARRKNNSDAAQTITDAALKLVDPLRESITSMETKIETLEKKDCVQDATIEKMTRQLTRFAARIAYLMGGIESLMRQIKDAGGVPCFTPDKWEPFDEWNMGR